MRKRDIIKMLVDIRREDKEEIKELIRINERLCCEFKDIIYNLQKYLQTQKEGTNE